MRKKDKIVVAMVCHVSNPKIRSHLKLDKGGVINVIKMLLGEKYSKSVYTDIAAWNTALINDFKKRDDIEFHIVASHSGMVNSKTAYEEEGVYYTFLSYKLAGAIRRVVKNNKTWLRLNPFAKKVKQVIDDISPDLVVLMGTENPYYSCTVLGITKYPVYVLCQTVYNNPARKSYGIWNTDAVETEMSIFKEHRYFGVFCKLHYDLVRQYSPSSIIFKFGYPRKRELLEPIETKKEYDFVNFAMMMDSRKGFPDTIQALAIVKKKYPNVKLNLIGTCTEEKMQEFLKMIDELDLKDNVFFTPFFEKQADLFRHIQKSCFAVLPCKLDNISGTMNQSMQLGLPLIVYKTSGTPSFNRNKQCVLIAEKEDVKELAKNMLLLMDNSDLADMLSRNARELQEKDTEEAQHNGERLIENFKAIIDNFYEGVQIPESQLFNPEKDD